MFARVEKKGRILGNSQKIFVEFFVATELVACYNIVRVILR